jgi:hypothetical protein
MNTTDCKITSITINGKELKILEPTEEINFKSICKDEFDLNNHVFNFEMIEVNTGKHVNIKAKVLENYEVIK